jgi:hypothetical protein
VIVRFGGSVGRKIEERGSGCGWEKNWRKSGDEAEKGLWLKVRRREEG